MYVIKLLHKIHYERLETLIWIWVQVQLQNTLWKMSTMIMLLHYQTTQTLAVLQWLHDINIHIYVQILCCVFKARTGRLASKVCAHWCQTSWETIKTPTSNNKLFVRSYFIAALVPNCVVFFWQTRSKRIHLLFLLVLTGLARPR